MPYLTLVYPCVGREPGRPYVRSWQMQPLAMAVLAACTPADWQIRFFDDRVEPVDYDGPVDLVGISIETFTARRGYQIARRFRARGVPVVLGGYHATLCPDEALRHADAVCLGEAEPVWVRILDDAARGRLGGIYGVGEPVKPMPRIRPDREVFRGKPYFGIALVETGRGCPNHCSFCSVTAFFRATHRRRPVEDIVTELAGLKERFVFFVDDNITADGVRAVEVFEAIEPLKLKWVSQATVASLRDEGLVRRMAQSGCVGVLLGFESLDARNLAALSKPGNAPEDYAPVLATLRRHGIAVYGAFMFGTSYDRPDGLDAAVRFAQRERLYLAAFNHVVPFPGTPLFEELGHVGALHETHWWLSERYRFGGVPFDLPHMPGAVIAGECLEARKRFYSTRSILRRATDWRANANTPRKAATFLSLNFMQQHEIQVKRGLPLGDVVEGDANVIREERRHVAR